MLVRARSRLYRLREAYACQASSREQKEWEDKDEIDEEAPGTRATFERARKLSALAHPAYRNDYARRQLAAACAFRRCSTTSRGVLGKTPNLTCAPTTRVAHGEMHANRTTARPLS